MRGFISLSLILVCIWPAGHSWAAVPTADFLVKAHESACGNVKTVWAQVDCVQTSFNRAPTNELLYSYTWARQGNRERQQFVRSDIAPSEQGRPLNLGDLYEDGTTQRFLMNWNTDDPQPIHPWVQGTVRAWFQNQDTKTTSLFPNPSVWFAMMQFQATMEDDRRSLRELVRSTTKATVSRSQLDDHDVFRLSCQHPDARTNGPFQDYSFDIYIDPSVGYMVRKFVVHQPNLDPTNAASDAHTFTVEAVEFLTDPSGAHIPKLVQFAMTPVKTPGKPVMVLQCKPNELNLNAPLPSDAFAFTFPANAIVYQLPAEKGHQRAQLWGPNNQPIKPIRGLEDLGAMPTDFPVDLTDNRSGLFLGIFACGFALVAAAAIIAYRKRRSR